MSAPIIESNIKKNKLELEFAIFFDEVEKNLPKTREMASVGHAKIMQAVYPAYLKMRGHIYSRGYEDGVSSVNQITYSVGNKQP